MICSDSVGIEAGSLLKLSGNFTVAAHSADEDIVAGIASGEKIALDGLPTIDVYRGGIFKSTVSGSTTAGFPLAFSSVANKPKHADASCSGAKTCGIAFETAVTDATIFWELRPGVSI